MVINCSESNADLANIHLEQIHFEFMKSLYFLCKEYSKAIYIYADFFEKGIFWTGVEIFN